MRKVNQETIQDTQSYPCETETSHETDKSLLKFLESSHKPKVICTDRNIANPVKTCHGFIVRLHFVDPRHMVLLKEQYAEFKKVLQQYCYNQDWMKGGGLILRSAAATCEMFKTSWQMEKHRMKDDLENHSKGQQFLLEQWLNIIRFQREIYQELMNLARNLESFLAMS